MLLVGLQVLVADQQMLVMFLALVELQTTDLVWRLVPHVAVVVAARISAHLVGEVVVAAFDQLEILLGLHLAAVTAVAAAVENFGAAET